MASQKRARHTELRLEHFTPREAREYSILSKNTPALRLLREERIARWARFEHIASRKIAEGKWRRSDIPHKWLLNLSRMYSRRGWRVQEGPTGRQQPMAKGSPNPWAMYRDAERRVGGPGTKDYVSPWEVRQIAGGVTQLEKGLIFVQQMERKAESPGGLSNERVKQWIDEKTEAIGRARGRRRAQLIIERNRLERLLG